MDSQVGIFLSNPCEEKVGMILTLLLSARRPCRMLSLYCSEDEFNGWIWRLAPTRPSS